SGDRRVRQPAEDKLSLLLHRPAGHDALRDQPAAVRQRRGEVRHERQLRIFLLGSGISYSRSPAMHNAAFQALEMDDWSYELLDVPPGELRAAVLGLRAPDVAGTNVTIPHKPAVMDQLDTISPEAVRARAV